MASKATEKERWFDIRMIDRSGVFHVHHWGDRASARERAARMAAYHWPREDGYRSRWNGDRLLTFKGETHVGEISLERLERVPDGDNG